MFDGPVARRRNRTAQEKQFGIQIDSLADIVAFGVLPAVIGFAVGLKGNEVILLALYVLAALTRLAYYNVTEEERQRTEGGVRKAYTGLPVTSAALIFPTVMMLRYILPMDISFLYFPVTLITGYLFLCKFQIPKLHLRGILVLVGIGLLECVLLLLFFFMRQQG
jgi:CDP-diacylglycerol--serine O-phosphatidyltransferase